MFIAFTMAETLFQFHANGASKRLSITHIVGLRYDPSPLELKSKLDALFTTHRASYAEMYFPLRIKAYCGQKSMLDYYQVLGVKSTASIKEIKAAYKRLARLQHPDLNGGSPKAAQAFVQLSRARDILIDPQSRAAYDAQRNAYAAKGAHAPVVNPTLETYVRRARSDARIKENLEKFLVIEREEVRALREAVFPIVAFLFAAFFCTVGPTSLVAQLRLGRTYRDTSPG
jgi:DnaJ-domain-containing protein 1